jgi:drug/metabolite transporter (DMT)-like permease
VASGHFGDRVSLANRPVWLPYAPWLFLLVWSAGYAMAKLALLYTGPLNLLALRFVGASAVLWPVVLIVRPAWPRWDAVRDILVVAFFLQLVHFGCIYVGLWLGASAGVMALFAASQPILITIVAGILTGLAIPARVWVGLGLGLCGAGWVIGVKGEFSDGALLGALLGFCAMVGLSIGQVYDKRTKPVCHPLLVYVLQYGFAGLVSAPIALAFEGFEVVWTVPFVSALIFLVLVNSLLGIFLMLTMVRFGQISRVTSIMFLVPGVAALIAWFVVGEVMPILAWPGILCAACGVLLVLYAPTTEASGQ